MALRDRMRVLVTGANGMVGRALVRELTPRHEVLATDVDSMDVTDAAAVERTVAGFRPHAVAHLGAWTDVDGCELDPAKALRVNGDGTRHVAGACRAHRARMLYVSTDYVFDGTAREPIREDARPNPINEYGRSKLAGEAEVRKALTEHWIVRTSWVFGDGGKNFVDTVARLAEERELIEMVDDQVGSPTYAADLAPALVTVLESRHHGTYHATNDNECTWYMLAQEILRLRGSTASLVPVPTEAFPRPANRPRYSVLANHRLHHVLGHRLRSWREAVREYLSTGVPA
ncbi:MAG: dTDP-4-dehydrorhamnose reductase [Candidatus Eisenbacteria bacterium]|nr:dTDP-4-dehydrorhamnose reductase [Candidatus Eisenbacteria bacterium]